MARQEYRLGDSTNPNVSNSATPNTAQVSLWWNPNIVIIINTTSNPVFIYEGTRKLPSATNYNIPIAPGASLRLPTDSNEFGIYLPLTPALTDLTALVFVIFDQLPSNG